MPYRVQRGAYRVQNRIEAVGGPLRFGLANGGCIESGRDGHVTCSGVRGLWHGKGGGDFIQFFQKQFGNGE